MNRSQLGALVGLALGFAGWFGGFGAFLVVALCGAAGWAAGHVLEDDEARQRLWDRLDRSGSSGDGRRRTR
ncbi:hypothetical protein GCM10010329_62190 [Streptomyces spiroverticillatus]|uniref:DUF2273 domain-containing protein n=1 Tax=Streptomyces finlayi TaxID=67296 RepID=A0A919CE83_9ACTN|nr:hypothetical protein [Streptomyces finlayi]GHA30467.1 hypothetical protein GCM10010329_62190 [Streptomyces spiroverticillatus]GHD14804.1 hypothetical protein GCM10010334_74240 [Streptomyces finlayi]